MRTNPRAGDPQWGNGDPLRLGGAGAPGERALGPSAEPPPLPGGEALLVVPPFWTIHGTCLGVHILQACARRAGVRVDVLYANLWFAARIGEAAYCAIVQTPGAFIGERLFAPAAYGASPLEPAEVDRLRSDRFAEIARGSMRNRAQVVAALERIHASSDGQPPPRLVEICRTAGAWVEEVVEHIASYPYRVVGCTTMFDMTAASVALLGRIKTRRPDIWTVIGGSNCEGEMAEGVASLGPKIDAVFSGESETTFVDCLRKVREGKRPRGGVIPGKACIEVDALPAPNYHEFFDQYRHWLPAATVPLHAVEIQYEMSRGCSWGEKRPCSFCAYNGERVRHRVKSPDKVLGDLKTVLNGGPSRVVRLADSALPSRLSPDFFRRLAREIPALQIHCFLTTRSSLPELVLMTRSGVTHAQAGVEALSTRLLRRIGKDANLRQNLAFLRHARVTRLLVYWNLLWAFPGDEAQNYEETIDLIPLIHHLQPPSGFCMLNLSRFSAYFERPDEYGIRDLAPRSGYERFLPRGTDARKIDYRFTGSFESACFSDPGLLERLHRAVEEWRSLWSASAFRPLGQVPALAVFSDGGDRYRLIDTRQIAKGDSEETIDGRQAEHALVARPFADTSAAAWAIRRKVAVARDGWLIPLATAGADLLLDLEKGTTRSKPQGDRPGPS